MFQKYVWTRSNVDDNESEIRTGTRTNLYDELFQLGYKYGYHFPTMNFFREYRYSIGKIDLENFEKILNYMNLIDERKDTKRHLKGESDS